ncbi:hypothetical protein ACIBKY_16930 [Nonomuraea sp. NPDC050394]|uniref:hypothetical protein n=1 Tax=Nonomuraea sp. NPDC050394 TaxID=3364363 RepID=UPI0037BE1260
MTLTERDLRELLESDSLDGRHRGVTVADVDRRVRRIRTRRLRAVTAVAAAAVAVAALSSGTATPSREEVWEGVLAQPAPSDIWLNPPTVARQFTKGGKRETLTFLAGAPAKVAIAVECRLDTYLLVWLNGMRVANEPCGGRANVPSWMRTGLQAQPGRNTVTAILVPRSAVPGDTLGAAAAEEMAAWAGPFAVTWTLQVMEQGRKDACREKRVIVDPHSGREVLSWKCDPPVLQPDRTGS